MYLAQSSKNPWNFLSGTNNIKSVFCYVYYDVTFGKPLSNLRMVADCQGKHPCD